MYALRKILDSEAFREWKVSERGKTLQICQFSNTSACYTNFWTPEQEQKISKDYQAGRLGVRSRSLLCSLSFDKPRAIAIPILLK